MRNLKKAFAVIIAISLIATFSVPAFATGSFIYSMQAATLNDLGLYKGVSMTTFDPDLGADVDRQTAIVLLLRLLGKEDIALAMTDTDANAALANATDRADIATMFKKQIAYAVKNGIYLGTSTTSLRLDPKGPCSGNMFAAFILRNIGYSQPVLTGACDALTAKGGLTAAQAAAFATKNMIRDDIIGMMFGALQAQNSTGKTIIANLEVVVCQNTQYGFSFSLPKSWKGYTVVTDKWDGVPLGGAETIETGPIINIRHPLWTSENPRQDIPIMVFTLTQWDSLQKEKFHINNGIPFGPSELSHNSRYVFALPARYNYAFPTGFGEVETILNSKSLHPTENFGN